MDQGSTRKCSPVHNFAPTVTKFCVKGGGGGGGGRQALPQDTKFSKCRCQIVGRRVIFIWCLIHGSSWSGLIKAEPGEHAKEAGRGVLYFQNWQVLPHEIANKLLTVCNINPYTINIFMYQFFNGNHPDVFNGFFVKNRDNNAHK